MGNEETIRSQQGAFEGLVAAAWPVAAWRDVNVAVAVSGGADSVALLRALLVAKRSAVGRGEIFVLHFDHGVRETASAHDAAWVESLADDLGLRCVLGRSTPDGPPSESPSSEEALRNERRAFYEQSVNELGARFLATGHTASDQAETVLFRLLRGTGARGLAGIRQTAALTTQCALVRPLLGITRDQVVAYLAALGQAHRNDETNASDDYTRNWLRHQVLPLLAERFPAVSGNLTACAERAAETTDLVQSLAADLLAGAASVDGPERIRFDTATLATQPPTLVAEALRLAWRRAEWPEQKMTAEHWHRLVALAVPGGEENTVMFPGTVRAERIGTQLVLSRESNGPG